MPMFNFGQNIHHIARSQTACRFAGFLIPALACRANQDLTCAVVDMPVVAAARLESNVDYRRVANGKRGKIADTGKKLGVSGIY